MSRRIITASHVAATLRVAASLIELHGWHTDGYVPRDVDADTVTAHDLCPLCVLAAIAVAAGLPPNAWHNDPQDTDAHLAHQLMTSAAHELGVHVGVFRPGEIPMEDEIPERLGDGWNDQQADANTVIRALRDTATDLDAQGEAA